MAYLLSQLIGGIPMTAAAQALKSGIPNYMPPEFFRVTNQVLGNNVRYRKISGTRQLAVLVQYGAPSVPAPKTGVSFQSATLLHSFENLSHDVQLLLNLQSEDPTLNGMAIAELYRQQNDFISRFNNTRTAAVASMLANGKIWFDANGQMQYTSSGAVTTVDFGVPANNTGQANGIIGASWATSSTDIQGQIQALKRNSIETTGYELKHAFYGINVPGYLTKNDSVSKYLQGNVALQNQLYGGGEIGDGFMGLRWHPVYSQFGTDASGTVTEMFGADALTLTPDPTPDWYEFVEGSIGVPTTVDIQPTLAGSVQSVKVVYGKFGYSQVRHDPVGITQYAGDTFLPLCKVGGAMYVLDVTP